MDDKLKNIMVGSDIFNNCYWRNVYERNALLKHIRIRFGFPLSFWMEVISASNVPGASK